MALAALAGFGLEAAVLDLAGEVVGGDVEPPRPDLGRVWGRRREASAVPEDGLIEEMRAAVRGDRERARRRQIVPQPTEPKPPHRMGMPEPPDSKAEMARVEPEAEPAPADPVAPSASRRWLRFRGHRRS